MSNLPTFTQYIKLVANQTEANPRWRLGQSHFNVLAAIRPDMAELHIRGTALDPFHQNNRVPEYLAWVQDNWDTWETVGEMNIKDWYEQNPDNWSNSDEFKED